MTILPKKKQNKNTTSNEDERDNDISSDRYVGYVGHSNGGQGVGGGQLSPQGRNVVGWSSRNEDKRTAPETGHTPIGPSHSKRRHRNARGVDVNPDMQRSLINTVLSMNKSALSSPSNSPRNNLENDSSMPSSSNGRDDNERQHPGSMLIPVNFGSDNGAEEEEEEEEDFSGYNSGDEYAKPGGPLSADNWEEKEHLFERLIRKKGFNIKKMSEDGACLFRAVADQVYGDQEMHSEVRKMCMDYMVKNGDYFSQYVTENFEDYIQRKRSDHIHGNHIEIQALSEIFNRPIQVYHYSAEPINIENCQKTDNEPIRLSYHRNTHYNSIVNPFKATIGVGLGLPAFKPGHAEKSLVEKALRISEQHELEQAMLEDKIRATDWEATNEAIEEQVARESYIEWLKENERRSKKSCATSTLTRFDDETNNGNNNNTNNNSNCNISPRCYSPRSSSSTKGSCSSDHRSSPKRCPINNNNNDMSESKPRSPPLIPNIDATSSFVHEVHPTLLGLREHEEPDAVVIQALALSQSEYLDSLKQSRNQGANNSDGQSSHHDLTHDLTLPSTSSKSF